MSKNKVRIIREKLGFTQAELAEKTNLSIRTIQRVESGKTIPKGHTLKVLAKTLEVEKSELLHQNPQPIEDNTEQETNLKLKMVNLSSLLFLGVPFGNLIFPIWMWKKNREDSKVDEVGRKIISFQILWTICTCILLIISPFFQGFFPENVTLILVVLLISYCANIYFVLKTAIALARHDYDNLLPIDIQFL